MRKLYIVFVFLIAACALVIISVSVWLTQRRARARVVIAHKEDHPPPEGRAEAARRRCIERRLRKEHSDALLTYLESARTLREFNADWADEDIRPLLYPIIIPHLVWSRSDS